MKRQAAEKRGLWGQVFGVVRIAAQGKRERHFSMPCVQSMFAVLGSR